MSLSALDARVRAAINAGFLASGGAPPGGDELAARAEVPRDVIFESLRRLEAQGSLTLRPGTLDIWTAPPFSATPTAFRVSVGESLFWGGCAWCALGVCALAHAPGRIRSALGGEASDVEVDVGVDGPINSTLHVHFAVPARRWADSLGYACNTILLFASPDDVDAWAERRRLPRGVVVPIEQTWRLAVAWFANATRAETQQRHRADLDAIFHSVGLEDPFFSMRG